MTTPTPPSAKLPKPSTRSPRPAHRVANDFLRAIDAKVDVYSARPVFGQRAVQTQMIANASRSSSPRRSHYARALSQSFAAESDVDGHHGDSPQPVHVYNPSIVGAFLSKAWAHHTQTIADSIKREGMTKLSTPPTRTPSTVRVTPAQQRTHRLLLRGERMVRARDGLRRGHAAACEWQMAREALHRGRRSYRRRRAPWPAELRGPPTPRFCVTRGLAAVPPLLGRHARRRWREAPSDRRRLA